MRTDLRLFFLPLLLVAAVAVLPAADPLPQWAYGFISPSDPPTISSPFASRVAQDDGRPRGIPGSTRQFSLAQLHDGFGPADWYPADHPSMPDIVAHGRRPTIRACALCHYPNGKGRAENAGISGLPHEYLVQTLLDYKNGRRKSADLRKTNAKTMIAIAQAMTEEEIRVSSEYFASIPWTPWIKVVETDRVPKTRVVGGLFLALEGDEREPIGQRIVEVPIDPEATEDLRDSRSGFVAYAPAGSLKKGQALVTTGGGGKTVACTVCHGANLMGLGPVPGIAGRSPSYIVRQLYDTQQGSRNGLWADLMKPVVARLSVDDMLSIAAYTASLPVAAKGGNQAP